MYKNKKIGVVILNYNDASTTKNLVISIKNYEILDNIIVVDNLSTDNSFSILSNLQDKKTCVIQSDKNGGYSYGNNYGVNYLLNNKCVDIIFIANPDVIFNEVFVMNIVDDIICGKADAATGRMLDINGNFVPNCLKIDSFFDDLISCTLIIKKIIRNRPVLLIDNDFTYTNSIPGSLFAISSMSYKKINGFDSDVFLYNEEKILGKKFINYGIKMGIDTRVSFIHNHSVSISKSINKLKRTIILYNSMIYYYRTYEHISLFKQILLYLATRYGIVSRFFVYNIEDAICKLNNIC